MTNDTKAQLIDHRVLIMSTLLTTGIFTSFTLYSRYLKPIRKVTDIPERMFHKKELVGKVTRVGDGDNFHFYHTPGGIFTGWNWLRFPPKINARNLKGKTLHVRLCGVDAPERAHFGKPAQPFSDEALDWLKAYLLGKKVRVKPLSLDQYGRVVGKVSLWTLFGKKNVSLEMIKNGWGVVYEGKSSGQFDGDESLFKYWETKAQKAKKGMWCKGTKIMTPGEYKKLHSSK